MDTKSLGESTLVQDFFTSIEAAPNTRRSYLRALQHYTDLTGMSPDQLIEEAEQEIIAGVLPRKRKIRSHLLRFKEYLEEKDYAPSGRKSWTAGVRSFYHAHEIDLPRVKTRNVQPLLKNTKPLPTRDDILGMLAHSTPRMRAMILVTASSGMAQNEMRHLTVGQFMDGCDGDNVTTLHVRRLKVNKDYITFLSPEATEAVLVYIADRERREGRKLGKDDLIFATRTGKPTDRRDIVRAFARVAEQSGIENDAGTFNRVRPHAMRKFFYSTLLNNGADVFFAKFLMGHGIDETHETYFRADVSKLKARYLTFLPHLSIEGVDVRVIESHEYRELKDAVDELTRFLIPDDEQDPNATLADRVKHIKREQADTAELITDLWNESTEKT